MELLVLGSGSAHARAERGQAGYVVSADHTRLIVDLGSGTLGRLCSAGVRAADLDAILLTHWHPDHVSDLVPVLFEIKHTATDRTEPLVVYGPPAFQGVFDAIMTVFGQWCVGEAYDVVVREVEGESFSIGPFEITAHAVPHGLPAVGYRIEGPGGVLALTGDTGADDRLVALADAADLLVADCTLAGDAREIGHLSATEAGALAHAAGARSLLLTHLSPAADAADVVAEARAAYGGPVSKAEDFLRVSIPRGAA